MEDLTFCATLGNGSCIVTSEADSGVLSTRRQEGPTEVIKSSRLKKSGTFPPSHLHDGRHSEVCDALIFN